MGDRAATVSIVPNQRARPGVLTKVPSSNAEDAAHDGEKDLEECVSHGSGAGQCRGCRGLHSTPERLLSTRRLELPGSPIPSGRAHVEVADVRRAQGRASLRS